MLKFKVVICFKKAWSGRMGVLIHRMMGVKMVKFQYVRQ
jgi:hypothetical protein